MNEQFFVNSPMAITTLAATIVVLLLLFWYNWACLIKMRVPISAFRSPYW